MIINEIRCKVCGLMLAYEETVERREAGENIPPYHVLITRVSACVNCDVERVARELEALRKWNFDLSIKEEDTDGDI